MMHQSCHTVEPRKRYSLPFSYVRYLHFLQLLLFIISGSDSNTIHDVCQVTAGTLECHGVGATNWDFLSSVQDKHHIRQLDVTAKNLREIPDETFLHLKFHTLKRLILSKIGIQTLGTGSFRGLMQLQYLDLSLNNISKVHRHTFEDNVKITVLDLSANRLNELDFLYKLYRLREVNLRFNDITTLRKKTFWRNSNLNIIDLSNNKINYIENNTFSALTQLKVLNLTANSLTRFYFSSMLTESSYYNDPDSYPVENLYLYIDHNKLENVEFICGPLLYSLSLSNNFISHISATDFQFCPILSLLNLNNNLLNDIQFVKYIPFLKELFLENNHISHVARDSFQDSREIRLLNLARNNISNVHFTKIMENLETLNLRQNNIDIIDTLIFENILYLEILILSSNFISDLKFLEYTKSLKQLELNDNRITYVPKDTFVMNKKLEVLHITDNYIEDLEFVKFMPNVESLLLMNNTIREIDVNTFNHNWKLTYIDLRENLINDFGFLCMAPALKYVLFHNFAIEAEGPTISSSNSLVLYDIDTEESVNITSYPVLGLQEGLCGGMSGEGFLIIPMRQRVLLTLTLFIVWKTYCWDTR